VDADLFFRRRSRARPFAIRLLREAAVLVRADEAFIRSDRVDELIDDGQKESARRGSADPR
jgi:hypothetical protein